MYKCSGIFLDTVRKKKAVEAAMNPGGRIKAFAAWNIGAAGLSLATV